MSEALTLHDQLTAALAGALTEMWQPTVGHSCTGDLPALTDDARTLAQVAEKIMGDVWEQGRKHGLRQAWKPHDTRVKQLEEEIEGMQALEEANGRAFALKCLRVRELEAKLDAIDRIHGTYHAGPDDAEYCTGCGKPHPCPTRTAAQ